MQRDGQSTRINRLLMAAAAVAMFSAGPRSTRADTGNWVSSGGTSWNSAGNWNNTAVPQNAGDTATLSSGSSQTTVTLDGNDTVGTINFAATGSYSISPGSPAGILTLDNGPATAGINDFGGTHTLASPVVLNSTTAVSVSNPADSMILSGPISGAGGLRVLGAGTVNLSGSNSYSGGTTIKSGTLSIGAATALPAATGVLNNGSLVIASGTAGAPVISGNIIGNGGLTVGTASASAYLQFAGGIGASNQTSLTLAAGSTLDIANNALVINYGSPAADPIGSIVAALTTGAAFNGSAATWTGTGITSSLAAASNGKYSVGYLDGNNPADITAGTVATNQIIVQYALSGDAFLENSVGFDDLLTVAQHYGVSSGMDWAQGSFDYTGAVGFGDLLSVAQNYGTQFSLADQSVGGGGILKLAWQSAQVQATSSVPEPTGTALVAIAAALAARRRACRK